MAGTVLAGLGSEWVLPARPGVGADHQVSCSALSGPPAGTDVYHLLRFDPHSSPWGRQYSPILQMRKQALRGVKWLPEGNMPPLLLSPPPWPSLPALLGGARPGCPTGHPAVLEHVLFTMAR